MADPSLSLLSVLEVARADSVLDVGGGASTLVDGLVSARFVDLTVLDVSAVALDIARQRLGPAAAEVEWIVADLLAWQPTRRYAVWHDRALAHFFTTDGERAAYRRVLDAATGPGSVAIVGTFAPAGPESCSGLTVVRADRAAHAELVGPHFELVRSMPEEHVTPGGATQPFLWTAWRKLG